MLKRHYVVESHFDLLVAAYIWHKQPRISFSTINRGWNLKITSFVLFYKDKNGKE